MLTLPAELLGRLVIARAPTTETARMIAKVQMTARVQMSVTGLMFVMAPTSEAVLQLVCAMVRWHTDHCRYRPIQKPVESVEAYHLDKRFRIHWQFDTSARNNHLRYMPTEQGNHIVGMLT